MLALKDYKKSQEEECGTPDEHGCSSPAKDSAILRPLLAPDPPIGSSESKSDHEPSVKEDAAKDHAKGTPNPKDQPENKPATHKPGAVNIQDDAKEMEHERDLVEQRADFYDAAELFLEISIVLCSIALLSEMKLFWKLSFISTILGVGIALWGWAGVR